MSLRRNCSRISAVSSATTCAVRSIRKRAASRCCSCGLSGSIVSYGRRARSSRIAWRSVFDGIVPVWIDTPPTRSRRSTTATRLPSFAPCTAARCPPGPEPITSRSRSTPAVLLALPLLPVFGHESAEALVLLPAGGAAFEVCAHAGHPRLGLGLGQLHEHVEP